MKLKIIAEFTVDMVGSEELINEFMKDAGFANDKEYIQFLVEEEGLFGIVEEQGSAVDYIKSVERISEPTERPTSVENPRNDETHMSS